MPKFPRFTAKTSPPRGSGLVRATDIGALTRTGDTAIWRGVSRLGQATQYGSQLAAVAYQKRQRLDDAIQWGNATQKIQEIFNDKEYEIEKTDFKLDMPQPGDPDYDKILAENSTVKREKFFKEAFWDIDERVRQIPQGFSRRENAERFKTWYADKSAVFKLKITHAIDAKLDSFQRAALLKLSTDAARSGEIETANSYIDTMDRNELITPEQAATYKEQAIKIAEQQDILLAINYAGATLVEEDIKTASKTIEKSKVFATEAEKIPFRNQLKGVLKNARDLRNEQIEANNAQATKELSDLMMEHKLTTAQVQARKDLLKGSDYTSWSKVAIAPRDFPTDPNTEARILREIEDPESTVAKSDILDLIGKKEGLSTDDARRFIADLDYLRDPWFKRIDSWLKSQLGWDGAYEKFANPQGGISYKLVIDQLFDTIETEKLKGKDIYDKGTELAIAPIVDYWEEVLRLEKPEIARLTALLRGEKVEPETKTKRPKPIKKSDVLDPEGIFR